ncbi:MAG: OsmC family protein [Lentimicrobiaceae bacterium]|jgi:putative redox protein|nr:OsmC family protein [Lentimicrobiaceae bacterium]
MEEVKFNSENLLLPLVEARIELVNNRLHFKGQAGNNSPVDVDYIPPLGDNLGYTSLELFLISLATCVSSAVLPLLRKMKKEIKSLQVVAKGKRRNQHPTCFEEITLEFVLQSPDTKKEEVEKLLHLAEETYCPVWAMIKNNVKVNSQITII